MRQDRRQLVAGFTRSATCRTPGRSRSQLVPMGCSGPEIVEPEPQLPGAMRCRHAPARCSGGCQRPFSIRRGPVPPSHGSPARLDRPSHRRPGRQDTDATSGTCSEPRSAGSKRISGGGRHSPARNLNYAGWHLTAGHSWGSGETAPSKNLRNRSKLFGCKYLTAIARRLYCCHSLEAPGAAATIFDIFPAGRLSN